MTGILVLSGGVRHMANSAAWSLGAYTQRQTERYVFTSYSRSWRDFPDFYDPALIARKNIEDLTTLHSLPPSGKHRYAHPGVAAMFLGGVFWASTAKCCKGDSPARQTRRRVLHQSIITDDPHGGFFPEHRQSTTTGAHRKQAVFDRGC